jgi:hypothetical protein
MKLVNLGRYGWDLLVLTVKENPAGNADVSEKDTVGQ